MRLSRSIPGAFIILGLCTASVFATATVDRGLGLYSNSWFIDGLQSYVNENPSYLGDFKDRAFAERTNVTGVTEGENLGGIFYSPASGLTLGLHFGQPVDTDIWNTDSREGLFNKSTYSVKAVNMRAHSSLNPTRVGAYRIEMLDSTVIDLMDPVDASALKAGESVSPQYREHLNQRNASFIASYDLSKVSLGIIGSYATSWNNKRIGEPSAGGSNTDEFNLVNTEYSFGLGMKYRINEKVTVDAAGQGVMYALDNSYKQTRVGGYSTKASYKSDGSMDFGGFTRINFKMTQTHKTHYYLGYYMLNRSTAGSMRIVNPAADTAFDVDAKDSFSRKGSQILFGISDEITVNETTRAFVGFGTNFQMFKNDYSGKDAITAGNDADKYSSSWKKLDIPFAVGLESKLSDNWTGRFGLTQTISKTMSDSGKSITGSAGANPVSVPTPVDDAASSATTMNMGVSYKLGNFSFDWLASVDMFVTGPYIVSGKTYTKEDKTPMSTSFAVTYAFGAVDASASSSSSSSSSTTSTQQPTRPR